MHELKIILSSKRDLGLLMVLFLMEFTRGAFFLTFLPLYAVNYLSISVAAAGLAVSAHYLFETLFKSTAGWELDRRGLWIIHLGLLLVNAANALLVFLLARRLLGRRVATAFRNPSAPDGKSDYGRQYRRK